MQATFPNPWPPLSLYLQLNPAEQSLLRALRELPDWPQESLAVVLARCERWLLGEALTRHQGHVLNTARALGLSPRTLYVRLKAHGLDPNTFRPNPRQRVEAKPITGCRPSP